MTDTVSKLSANCMITSVHCNSKTRGYWSFVYIRNTYVDQTAKPPVGSNQPKSLPPLFCLLVSYSACIVWHNITLLKGIWRIIEHPIEDVAEKPPRSIHFRQFPATLVFVAEKLPSPQDEGIFFYTGSIYFRQFWATLVLWQKSPPPPLAWGKIFYTGSIHFRQFRATLVFVAEKPPPEDEGKFFTLRLSISGNFQQHWFCGRKAPPPRKREIFLHWIYPFQAISSKFGFCGRKAPPPLGWGKIFYTGSIHFRQFPAMLVFVAERSPWGWGNFFLHCIYPFQAISSNFGFCGRKAAYPPGWGKIFLHWIYPFQAISHNFGFCGRKASPSPSRMREFFFYTGSIHFRQFPATLVFEAEKHPPQDDGKFFYTGSIHFRQFPAILVFVAEKLPPPGWGKIFYTGSIHFRQFPATLVFVVEKPPSPPQDEGNFFYTGSIHFRQFPANLVFVAEKPPPPIPPAKQGNVYVRGLLLETKDHLPGTVTVSLSVFLTDTEKIFVHFGRKTDVKVQT